MILITGWWAGATAYTAWAIRREPHHRRALTAEWAIYTACAGVAIWLAA